MVLVGAAEVVVLLPEFEAEELVVAGAGGEVVGSSFFGSSLAVGGVGAGTIG